MGHGIHWIAPLTVHKNTPQLPAKVEHIDGTAFKVTNLTTGAINTWHHHDPEELNRYLEQNLGQWLVVQGASFVINRQPTLGKWFSMTPNPLEACVKGSPRNR